MNSPTHQPTSSPSSILIVEDDRHFLTNLRNLIEPAGHHTRIAHDGKDALNQLEHQPVDLMLLDLQLPRMHGMDVLRRAVEQWPAMTVIIISGEGTISMAIEATKLGAYDYIEKPVDVDRLLLTIRNALEKSRLQRHRDRLLEGAVNPYRIVGKSAAMQTLQHLIDRAAASPGWIIIHGEHGVGKELVARAVHDRSNRADYDFIAVNCGALPEGLIESELFGYERGAFTGAVTARPGAFERANGGTLFLDEVSNLSPAAQASLLRTLQEREVVRLGGAESIPLDVRVIAATNKPLKQEIESGRFREDLYYRLSIIDMPVPPLRDRMEDVPLLIDYFLAYLHRVSGYASKTLDPEAYAVLMQYDWPGNIRQLRNVIERLLALTDQEVIPCTAVSEALEMDSNDPAFTAATSLRQARERFERAFILKSLQKYDWKLQSVAADLGIDRTNLWKKINRYGLRRV